MMRQPILQGLLSATSFFLNLYLYILSMEKKEKKDKKGTFGFFMLMLIGFMAALIGLSYLALSLIN